MHCHQNAQKTSIWPPTVKSLTIGRALAVLTISIAKILVKSSVKVRL